MKISRRKFIKTSTAALGAVTLLRQTAAAQLRRAKAVGDALSRLTWDSFYPYQNTDFIFSDQDGQSITLTLVNMTDIKPTNFVPRSPGEECFYLTFSGTSSGRRRTIPWTQNTYSVEHFALGKFDLFITSGGRQLKSDLYSAVINRIAA